jgi:crotonobetainyl-CoA:carnitine CoA-transferase CaiB-like acyl-CoA transferase
MSTATAPAPLAGIRVLDFTHAAAGPYCTMWLAEMGADVIKIEKPGRGDGARYMGEPLRGPKDSDYYMSLNRNKRAIALDLHDPVDVETARQLARSCDIVVQNFRPGVMDRLGLGFDDLRKERPDVVYCSISAFGDEGPWRDRPANDIIMQGITGLMAMTGEPAGEPNRIGIPICDYSSGLFGLVGILAALQARAHQPEGQHIKVNMFDAAVAVSANYIPGVLTLDQRIPRMGRGHFQIVPYQAFACAGGEYLIVGAFTNAFWKRLCQVLGHDEWIDDPRFETNDARLENRDLLVGMLEEIFAARSREEWGAVLDAADVPNTPVLHLDESLRTEQARVNGTVRSVASGDTDIYMASFPVRCATWPEPPLRIAPEIGQHTDEVVDELVPSQRRTVHV